jgi:hypothetical protein
MTRHFKTAETFLTCWYNPVKPNETFNSLQTSFLTNTKTETRHFKTVETFSMCWYNHAKTYSLQYQSWLRPIVRQVILKLLMLSQCVSEVLAFQTLLIWWYTPVETFSTCWHSTIETFLASWYTPVNTYHASTVLTESLNQNLESLRSPGQPWDSQVVQTISACWYP